MGIKDSSLWAREILSFLETAKNGSINGTAEANAMKQSNLSRTLKSLEEKLKCQLLERGYNGVRLTENGREVFKVACDLDKVKDVKNPKIAVLGLAFKDGTDDCRESPAMDIVGELLLQGADITAYDPKAMGTACGLLGNKISYADDMYACLKDADVLAILTEWNEFKALDLVQAAHLMRHKQIVDCRNLINAEQAAANGFDYQGIGK